MRSTSIFCNYHLNKGKPRCALKVDLRKAFDTVRWDYLQQAMAGIGIPTHLQQMIWKCITTPHFSVSINGESHGFFKSQRGLWQGDQLSPYLFVLAMEGLNGIMERTAARQDFRYHWKCKTNGITHVSFADDLMMFCHADEDSVSCMKESLHQFGQISGLTINNSKSSLYTSGIDDGLRQNIKIADL